MSVITISREFGSGGDEVASRLCTVLGYHSFGKAQIIQIIQETSLSKLNAVDYTEDNHEVQTFLNRLLRQKASPVQKIAWSEDPTIATRPERADVHAFAVLSIEKRAILAALQANNMVIIGRGGQILLKDSPGVLHVRIEAPLDVRVARVALQIKQEKANGTSASEIHRTASELIAKRDIASADYIQRYFHANWADPKLYHMVINLGKLSVEQAVQMILTVVQNTEETIAG